MYKKRHLERRETLAYWPVEDAKSGNVLGVATNLSLEGLEIHGVHKFHDGLASNLRIKVDPELAGADQISLVAENVWCRAGKVPFHYHAGFKIIDISESARTSLVNLLKAFSYPAPADEDNSENESSAWVVSPGK